LKSHSAVAFFWGALAWRVLGKEVSRQDAEISTLEACALQNAGRTANFIFETASKIFLTEGIRDVSSRGLDKAPFERWKRSRRWNNHRLPDESNA
jgi:hypothetical protein